MKAIKLTLITICFCAAFHACLAQDTVTYSNLKYIGYNYTGTMNRSFVNKKLLFRHERDTVQINIKAAFDTKSKKIYDPGIFHHCELNKDKVYTIRLVRVPITAVPHHDNSYYWINAVFDKTNKSRFREIKKNTKYHYSDNAGRFCDISRELYEIVALSPISNCQFPL